METNLAHYLEPHSECRGAWWTVEPVESCFSLAVTMQNLAAVICRTMLLYDGVPKFGDADVPLPKVVGPCSTVKIMPLPYLVNMPNLVIRG